MDKITLYSYWRSSAAYRVRIALNLKQLPHEIIPVSLVDNGGEHRQAEYTAMNPQQLVPTLFHGDRVLRQSMAIIDYLDEVFPEVPMLLSDPRSSAWIRALSQMIACDVHPLNNLRVLAYLRDELGVSDAQRSDWYAHWIHQGFAAVERLLNENPIVGDFCAGDSPSMADCVLIPQVYNARRFSVDLSEYPNIVRIWDQCQALAAFRQASPEQQVDAS